MNSFAKKRFPYYFLFFILLLPILIFRDFSTENELKYLSIANESIRDGHFFAFFNHGVPYADKPPLFLWAVIVFRLIFGKHIMFPLAMLSLIPSFVVLETISRTLGKSFTEKENTTALFMLFTSAFFLGSSIVLRMDMLMLMFITLSLCTFYKMYLNNGVESRKQYLLGTFVFLSIFSKGAVGLLAPVLCILVFLFVQGEISKTGQYLGWRFWVALALECIVWFFLAYLDGGKEYITNLLFHQTVDRAVNSFHHKKPFYWYLISIWYATFPLSLIGIFCLIASLVSKTARKKIYSSKEAAFALSIFLTVFVMLSLVSSKIEIYLLPAFPALALTTIFALRQFKDKWWAKAAVLLPALLFIAIPFVSLFIDKFVKLPFDHTILFHSIFLAIGGILAFYFTLSKKKDIYKAICSISLSMLCTLFAAGFQIESSGVNSILSIREACNKAYAKASELFPGAKTSDTSYVYALKGYNAANADVFFNEIFEKEGVEHSKEFNIKEIEPQDIKELHNRILFVWSNDIARTPELKEAVATHECIRYGDYSIIIFP